MGCIPTAERADCVLAILDDAFPSKWCVEEMAAARMVQTIYASDIFRWEEVGKGKFWKQMSWWRRLLGGGLPLDGLSMSGTDFVNHCFEFPAIPFDRDYHDAAMAR